MKKRELGNSGIKLYPLAFGGNVFGWTVTESMSFTLLDAFVEAGFSLTDTADVYSRWVPGHTGGESETIIGKWLKRSGKRKKVVIATKVGKEMGPDRKGLYEILYPARGGGIAQAVADGSHRFVSERYARPLCHPR